MTSISFTLPPGVKSFSVSGPRHDGSYQAWVSLEPLEDAHGHLVHGINAGFYELELGIQAAVDKSYEKASLLMAEALAERASRPASKPPQGITSAAVKQETADLLGLLGL